MKRPAISLISLLACILHNLSAAIYTDTYTFATQSPLASGKWIKVEVEQEGIYEISYDELKAMGFANPSAVSIYGEGGAKRGLNMGEAGQRFVEDNPPQIPVLHKNNKIYFYGRGICTVELSGNRFTYKGRNIYNQKGHYFLTESGAPFTITSGGPDATARNTAELRSDGLGYALRDIDLMMGEEDAGQYFWEGKFSANPGHKFAASSTLPYAVSSGRYVLEAGIHVVRDGGNVSFAFNVNSSSVNKKPSLQYNHIWTAVTEGSLGGNPKADISICATTGDAEDSYFDYWLLSYSKDTGVSSTPLRQEIIGFPGIDTQASASAVSIPTGTIAFDISDPFMPIMLPTDSQKAYFDSSILPHTLAIFNPDVSQMRVSNPIEVKNTNLHSAVTDNISLLIIHVPETRRYAEKIAGLHRKYDNINVLTADVGSIYDEFGAGNADPLAIRMLARLLYSYGTKSLKNILFVGPIRSDVRNILGLEQPDNFLIAFQEMADISAGRRPAITFDYFGMTSDNVASDNLYETPMRVGVGWLPLTDSASAEIAIAKTEDYLKNLNSADFAWYVNEILLFAHGGDGQIHDDQLKTWERNITDMANTCKMGKPAVAALHQNTYGSTYTHTISSHLNSGNLINVYTGHARPGGFGVVNTFFTLKEFDNLRNRVPTFMMMSGCETISPDFGGTGIGIEPLIHSPRGMAGIIASGRTTYSSSNSKLVGYFLQGTMFKGNGHSPREVSPTAGECFAFMKTQSYNFNEMAYLFIGDPALTIPMPLRNASIEVRNIPEGGYKPGDVIEITGVLENGDNIPDIDSEGMVVAKLIAPTVTLPLPDVNHTYTIDINDTRLTAVKAKGSKGSFRVKLPIPTEASHFLNATTAASATFHIYISAYDPTTRLAYSGYVAIPVAKSGNAQASGGYSDSEPPALAVSFDPATQVLSVDVADNVGFLPVMNSANGIGLTIDGSPCDMVANLTDPAAVTAFSFNLHLGYLKPGNHSAGIVITDLCGNSTERNFSFTITDTIPEISINCNSAYAIDAMQFTVSSPSYENLELYILDSAGREIHTQLISGADCTWSRNDTTTGIKAPAGTYRAGVRSTDSRPVGSSYKSFVILD